MARLGELASEIEAGFACSKSKLVRSGVPHFRPFNIGSDGELDLTQVYEIPEGEAPNGKVGLRAGDVLFNNTNSADLVGKVAYIAEDIAAGFSNHLTRIRFDTAKIEPQFATMQLYYLWRHRYFERHCTQWVSQAAFNSEVLRNLDLSVPPLDEQHRIVDVLNRANGIRRLRREALTKARSLIPSLFAEMFGDPLDYQRQWPKKALGDLVAAFEGGKNLQAGSEHGGDAIFRILKVSAVTWGDFRPEESKPAPEDHAPPKHHFVRDGDLLFSRANTEELVGATVLVRNPPANLLLPDKLWRVVWRQSSEVISQYALAYFQHPSIRRAMGNLATGTSASMRNISQAKLRTLRMPVPPLSLQRAFAARVADIQSIINEQVRAAAAADQLVASLMARFFEG